MNAAARSAEIIVYWRPGCMFCSALFRRLDSNRVPHRRINIWDDPRAAARVRSIAHGAETVPTVTIGSVSLVNPRLDGVLAAASEHAPDAVPADWSPRQPGRLGRWLLSKLDRTASIAQSIGEPQRER